jgi:undecaprenyl-diphosphatase
MEYLEELNNSLFLLINAQVPASPAVVATAMFFAQYLVWIVPCGLVAAWLCGPEPLRRAAFRAAITALFAALISFAVGFVWPHPRPFVMGIGSNLLEHAPDTSFPSDHLTLWWAISFSLLMPATKPSTKPASARFIWRTGFVLSVLGLPMAWARIYLGVHYPLDILGAALVALTGASGVTLCEGRAFDTLFGASVRLYRFTFAPLIRLGCAKR